MIIIINYKDHGHHGGLDELEHTWARVAQSDADVEERGQKATTSVSGEFGGGFRPSHVIDLGQGILPAEAWKSPADFLLFSRKTRISASRNLPQRSVT